MAIFLTVTITIKDMGIFADYGEKAWPLFAEYGAQPVLAGQVTGHLHGTSDHQMEVVVQFPDRAALDNWYNSPEYQALIPQRNKGADVVFKIVEPMNR